MVFLDAASGEPLHPAARAVLLSAHDAGWADPRRLYGEARRARLLLDTARESVAAVLGVRADELSFCSSGTQAAHLAVLGSVTGAPGGPPAPRDLVLGAVEHSAVLQAGALHARHTGARVTLVPVTRQGRVEPHAVGAALTPGTALVALQSANAEVGTLQPVVEVAELAAAHGAPLFVDASASVARVPVPPGWSLLGAHAPSWGGPPGVGILVVRRGTRWRSPLPEDEHEDGRVPGMVALPGVLAAASALEAVAGEAAAESARLSALVEVVRARVAAEVPDVEVVGDPVDRLPHVVTFSCLYLDGEALVTALDRHGFAVSSGSACTASSLQPSHVLKAMGVLTHGNVRVSLPRGTAEADVSRLLDVLPGVVAALRAEAGALGL